VIARIQLSVAAALALVALVLAGVLLSRDDAASAPVAFSVGPSGWAGNTAPPALPPQDFRLRDQDGHVARLAASRGKVTVVTFLYTTCKDTCPLVASQILGALDGLPGGGTDVPAYAVSVDPAHDTPTRARAFLLSRRLAGRMRFLLGDEQQLAPVWKQYAVQPQGVDASGEAYEHSARVVLIDKRGRQRIGFPIDQLTPAALTHDIARLQAE
jgi:protein SCO1/2